MVPTRLPCPNLSQYLGGKLFLNLHLNFPIWLYLQFLGQTNWSLELPPPLRSFLLTRSKRQRLLQSNLGQNLQHNHHKCMRLSNEQSESWPDQVKIVVDTKIEKKKAEARVLQIVIRESGSGGGSWRREAKQPHFLSGSTSSHSHYNQPTSLHCNV